MRAIFSRMMLKMSGAYMDLLDRRFSGEDVLIGWMVYPNFVCWPVPR